MGTNLKFGGLLGLFPVLTLISMYRVVIKGKGRLANTPNPFLGVLRLLLCLSFEEKVFFSFIILKIDGISNSLSCRLDKVIEI